MVAQNGRQRGRVSGIHSIRMTVAVLAMLLLGVLCVAQVCYLSFFERGIASGTDSKECVDATSPDFDPDRDTNFLCYVRANTLRPARGEIYDDHGRLLVGNYNVFEVAFDGKQFAKEYADSTKYSSAEVDEMLHRLAKDFQDQFKERYPKRSEQFYYNFFTRNYKNRHYETLFPVNVWNERTWVSSIDTAQIKRLPYLQRKIKDKKTGEILRTVKNTRFLNFVTFPVRINPYGEMARRTLGISLGDRQYGMEAELNDILAGEEGSKKYLELNHAVVPLNARIDPVDGKNVHTTLNLEIQNAVHNEMSRKLQELGAEWGCAIVMETRTGEIKAVTNLRRQDKDNWVYDESMEYALNAKVEPGSTFKLASLLAFLETMPTDTECIYPMFVHTFKYPLKSGGYRSYYKADSKVRGEALGTPNEVFQRSSNIGIASMIFHAFGMKNFSGYTAQLAKFGLFDTVHTQMGDLMPAGIRNDGRFDNYYATCFGAGFNIPVLRTLMYYNAIANNGRMMAPLFVKYITNGYDTLERFVPEVVMEKMVSDRTLRIARAYLDSVVWGKYGTGRRYKDPTCPFAGKTGTRDLWDERTKSYNYDRNAVSFCGYFPKDNPKYTMIVYIYDVLQHSEVAVDVFGKIARSIMNSNNYSAMHNIEEYELQPLKGTGPVNRRLVNPIFSAMGYDTVRFEEAKNFYSVRTDDSLRCVLVQPLQLAKENGLPDLRGMIASDAVAVLARMGYRTALQGRGVVKRYEVEPGKLVRLYLEPVR